jgi:hypothetical protein
MRDYRGAPADWLSTFTSHVHVVDRQPGEGSACFWSSGVLWAQPDNRADAVKAQERANTPGQRVP